MHRLHLDRRTGDWRVSGRDNYSFSFSPFLVSQEGYQYQVGSMGGTMDLSHGKEQLERGRGGVGSAALKEAKLWQ